MKKFIITIGREYGSGGCEIAKKLSKKFGIEYYDEDLVKKVAEEKGVKVSSIERKDEKIDRKLRNDFGLNTLSDSSKKLTVRDVIEAQNKVIKELADKDESCIFVGRCADYALKERHDVFSIFIFSPFDERVRHIIEREDLTAIEATEKISQVNKQRHAYCKYVTGKARGDRDNKNFLIDSSFLGIDGTVDLIAEIVEKKFAD